MASVREFLPRQQSQLTIDGRPTAEFYSFLIRLAETVGESADTETIGLINQRLAEIQAELDKSAAISGGGSISVIGGLDDGNVILQLENDTASPDPFYYYGTDTDAAKGWHPTSDTVDAEDGIQKTVTPEGVAMLSPVGNLASVHGLATVGFSLRIDDGDWQTRVFNVAGDASLSDDGSAITITVESYPPELGYGGV